MASGSPGPTFENRNPANTDEVVGLMAKGSAADVEAAAEAAQAAFQAGRACPVRRAGTLCTKSPTSSTASSSRSAADMTREEGKTLPEAKGEVRRSINIFRYFAGEGSRMQRACWCRRERDRVHMFAHPQADRCCRSGHAVELPERDSGMEAGSGADLREHRADEACVRCAAERVAPGRSCHEAGIPKGVVNFVAGSGGEIGDALVNAKPLKAISFTGSCEIGNWLHAASVEAPAAHPARDGRQESDDRARRRGLQHRRSRTPSTRRSSPPDRNARRPAAPSSRMRIYDKFVDAHGGAHEEAEGRQRHGSRASTSGRPSMRGQLKTNLKYIEIGKKEGGKPKFGGNRLDRRWYDKGYFVEPTIFADVEPKMTHRAGRDLRTGAGSDACQEFRPCDGDREQHSVRTVRIDPDHAISRASSISSTRWKPAC